MRWSHALGAAASLLLAVAPASAGDPWLEVSDATADRLVAAGSLGATDEAEKDYAVGDLDQDGDDDLVVVRKQPFSTPGRRANVLLMNEGGVLVDRTAMFAAASDVDGDAGFLTPTNDRDVVIVDVDADGWPDVVTCTAFSDGQPRHIGHPRVYRNLGVDESGAWLGLRFEFARIPQLFTVTGIPTNPRFNEVAAGDVTGDGFPDLFFVSQDLGGDPALDLDDRVLVNDGTGHFFDALESIPAAVRASSTGIGAAIADVNGDGWMDLVKSTQVNPPIGVWVAYNGPKGFTDLEQIYDLAPTNFEIGDLDQDDRLDLVITDDGVDRILLNQGNGADGRAEFASSTLPSSSAGFGGNCVIADLDGDRHLDIIVTDVNFDIPGCARTTKLYRHDGILPGVSFGEPPLMGLAATDRTGVHDVALIDLDGNGRQDLIVGRCSGTSILLVEPVAGLIVEYTAGPPELLPPGFEQIVEIFLVPTNGGVLVPGSATLHTSIDGAPFTTSPIIEVMGIAHQATFPAVPCGSRLRYFVTAELTNGDVVVDPPGGADAPRSAIAAFDFERMHVDPLEDSADGWITQDEGATSGQWERVDPVGTIAGSLTAAPEDDATPGPGTMAFVTENGRPGEAATLSDVDGGPVRLVTPRMDLSGGPAIVRMMTWFFCDDASEPFSADVLTVDVSNDDGATWTPVPALTTGGTDGAWVERSLDVGAWIERTDAVRVRFSTADLPNDSVTEAGIDDLVVDRAVCVASCPADIDADGAVGLFDLLSLLSRWGPCGICPADLDDDGDVGFEDMLIVLGSWGPC